MLEHIRRRGKGYRSSWYVNLISREGISLREVFDGPLTRVRDYCESYLTWIANTVASANHTSVELINYGAFAEKKTSETGKVEVDLLPAFRLKQFNQLTLPAGQELANGLNDLWDRMSRATVQDNDASGIGRFFNALYNKCADRPSGGDNRT
jgi:hypothetical protein